MASKDSTRASWTLDRDEFIVTALQAQLKREYKDVKYLRDNSGFGWNEELGLPTAPDDVWAAVLKASPSCKKFRFTPFPLYEKLAILLDGAYADGRFSSMPPGSIEQRDNSGNKTASSHNMSKDYDNSDSSSDEASPPPKKLKQKLVDVQACKANHQQDPHDRVTQAIDYLIQNYSHLDGSVLANLADMMGQEFNATIFMTLRGPARDAWIAKNSN
ncbi:hypothetical protein H310_07184 [Aphanomyces invadans]|uniref:Myb/SANT-like domain-containing protein n=1 Tax=Aphanomyces invadans TaxID=157072 RepID=A0A024U4R5_9STRA|nr:hypothetical protein H310_07184 [Aphanomyces invadans]ETW00613.1 hypothetical protein H310_07184 [Aphanomyces invadans]|eukprot:XP_008870748.1 hypothetical protein H310_07184 [Aphanomyces invadans]